MLGNPKKSKLPVGPVMLGFFIFVVIGSGEEEIQLIALCMLQCDGTDSLTV